MCTDFWLGSEQSIAALLWQKAQLEDSLGLPGTPKSEITQKSQFREKKTTLLTNDLVVFFEGNVTGWFWTPRIVSEAQTILGIINHFGNTLGMVRDSSSARRGIGSPSCIVCQGTEVGFAEGPAGILSACTWFLILIRLLQNKDTVRLSPFTQNSPLSRPLIFILLLLLFCLLRGKTGYLGYLKNWWLSWFVILSYL